MLTQQDVTARGLEVQRLDEQLEKTLRAYPKGTEMPKPVQDSVVQLNAQRDIMNALYESTKAEFELRNKAGNIVNPLLTPGQRSAGSFDDHMKGYYGKLSNFNNTEDGRRAAELVGLFALGTVGNNDGNNPIRHRAQTMLRDRFGVKDVNEVRDLSTANNSSGGFLVPELMETAIIILREQYGSFEGNAQKVPLSTDTTKWPRRFQGIDAAWNGEVSTLNFDKSMAFNQITLSPKELTAFIAFSNNLSDDAIIPLGDYIAGEMAYKFSYKIDKAAFLGDGTSAYGGITGLKTIFNSNIPGTATANPGLVTATSGSATNWDAITVQDLVKFAGAMRALSPTTENWKYYCSWAFYQRVFKKFQILAGGNTNITISNGNDAKVVSTQGFDGHEVVITQVMPSAQTGADIVCYFGDLSMAAMNGVRRDTQIATSKEAGSSFANNQTYMRAIYRGDINIHDAGLTTVDPDGNPIAGPIVALATA